MFPRRPVDDLLENGIISKACYSFVSLFHNRKSNLEAFLQVNLKKKSIRPKCS